MNVPERDATGLLWASTIKTTGPITVAVALTFLRITAIAIGRAYPSAL
jgi:hypothetical protein